METEDIRKKYGLKRKTAAAYIDAITRLNQSDTAEEIQVSRDTINRYKHAFRKMTPIERLFLISSLTQDKFLGKVSEG